MSTSSTRNYSIVEPHPTVASTGFLHTGRGGAGNVTRVPEDVTRGSDARGPASRASVASISQPRKVYTSGRGGAGNVHNNDSPRMFSFDEELQRQLSQESHVAPVYHVGRGGAGNLRSNKVGSQSSTTSFARRTSDTGSADSTSSAGSGADYATRNLKKGLKKLAGVF